MRQTGTRTILESSDWSHTGGSRRSHDATGIEAFRREDDARNLALLAEWVPDETERQQILVETPARLFGFAA